MGTGEHVAFNIFRFEGSMLVKDWENMTEVALVDPSGHSQIDCAIETIDLDKIKENKKLFATAVTIILINEILICYLLL